MTATSDTPRLIHDLHWEDAPPDAGRWWISRARDLDGARDFFIAPDDMTDALVGLLRVPPQSHYTVVAATFLHRFESRSAAAGALKQDVAAALGQSARTAAVRRALLAWRLIRIATVLRKNAFFLAAGLLAGGALGLSVALFSAWTTSVGWPMVAAGVVLGAAAGLLLKMAVDAYRVRAVAGPWGRFGLIMLGVTVGAGATVAGALLTFWH